MRARVVAVVVLACAVAAGCAGGVLLATAPPADTTFSVAGRTFPCGPDATVTAALVLSYPGPGRHAFRLDGVELPDTANDRDNPFGSFSRRPAQPLVFSCDGRSTHRVQLVTGHSRERYVGCGIGLSGSPIPGEGVVGSGKSIEHPVSNTWQDLTDSCDVTWSSP